MGCVNRGALRGSNERDSTIRDTRTDNNSPSLSILETNFRLVLGEGEKMSQKMIQLRRN